MASNTASKKGVLQPLLIGLLVLAAFAIGSMWTELRMMKGEKGLTGVKPDQQIQEGETEPPEEVTELTDDQWQEVLKNPAYAFGDEGAKVTVIEFSDYQCPFCQRFFQQAFGQIETEYVDTGKVRYMFRDLPLSFHSHAQVAAEAARCAGEQGKYKEYHDKLFETQTTWAALSEVEPSFKQYAAGLGLNTFEFNSCLDEGKFSQIVKDDLDLAQKLGVSGTPSFFVNGKILVGAQPFSAFKEAIDAELE